MPRVPDNNSRDLNEVVAVVRSEIVYIRQAVEKLMAIVVEGNGNSLQSRIAVMEAHQKIQTEEFKSSQGNVIAIRMAILASVLGFVCSASLLAITLLLKK